MPNEPIIDLTKVKHLWSFEIDTHDDDTAVLRFATLISAASFVSANRIGADALIMHMETDHFTTAVTVAITDYQKHFMPIPMDYIASDN